MALITDTVPLCAPWHLLQARTFKPPSLVLHVGVGGGDMAVKLGTNFCELLTGPSPTDRLSRGHGRGRRLMPRARKELGARLAWRIDLDGPGEPKGQRLLLVVAHQLCATEVDSVWVPNRSAARRPPFLFIYLYISPSYCTTHQHYCFSRLHSDLKGPIVSRLAFPRAERGLVAGTR